MDKPWKVIFAFVAVFAAGAVVGGMFSMRRGAKRLRNEPPQVELTSSKQTQPAGNPVAPAPAVEKANVAGMPKEGNRPLPPMIPGPQLRQWAIRFNLTPQQQRDIRPIIQKTNEEYARLRVETTRVTEGMYADISAILTDDQRADFEEMKKKLQERLELEKKKRQEQQAAEAAAKKAGNRPQSE